mmetsp:Transcript_3139/g.9817  ORF Transcript_3139/g.9817 Transcript_3139/m.9817 type:complete len:433 (-) Transcript_3139:90-1388(-)
MAAVAAATTGDNRGAEPRSDVSKANEDDGEYSWITMPIELAVDIFARLDPASLSHCSAVCRSWKSILEDDRFWKRLFCRDVNKWKVYGNTLADTPAALIRRSSLSLFQKLFGAVNNSSNGSAQDRHNSSNCTETFKQKYVQQFFINRAEDPHQGVLRLEQAIGQRPVPRSAVHYVPMFGYLSKKLLYKMMWLAQSPFSVQGMFPGRKGVGSSIGFRIQKNILALAALTVPPDVELQHGFARKVYKSFKRADAFCFMVPTRYCPKRFERACHEMDLIPRTSTQPILVIALERSSLNLPPIDENGSPIAPQPTDDQTGSESTSPPSPVTGVIPGAGSAEGDGLASTPPWLSAFPGPAASTASYSYASSSVATSAPLVEGQYLSSCQIASLLGLQHKQRRWSVWTVSDSTDVLSNLQLVYKGCMWLSRIADRRNQ